jgi:hypothetical protein
MTTQREALLRAAREATEDYRSAKRDLEYQQALHRAGINNCLMDAVSREHVSYHRWFKATEAVAASQPAPSPQPPVIAKKPVTPIQKPAPQPAKATVPTTAKLDILGFLNDQCERNEARMWAACGLPTKKD